METGLLVIYADSEYNIIKNYTKSYWFYSTSLISFWSYNSCQIMFNKD